MQNQSIRADASARNLLDNLGITELLNQSGVTEVMINRPQELFVERSNGTEWLEMPELTLDKLRHLANILTTFNQKHISEKDPIHSVTLPDGERGQILIPPSCENGTIVFSFRKPSNSRFSLDDYVKTKRLNNFVDVAEINGKQFADVSGSLKLTHDVKLQDWEYKLLEYKENRDLNAFFKLVVEKHLNICMVGGTGSGKTTFTKAIADLIDSKTRIITIEDTHELDLPKHPNHVHLFYKEHITAKQIIAACMRLKPDRIFLTELRGDEAWDYLSALNTGHAGGLTSVHANNAESVFYRIAQLAKESATGRTMDYDFILNTVRSTIDVVCFFNRTYMTELYYNPVAKFKALSGRS